ncbi:SAM-dependent methyltransferase [Halospeciosus flavus]|uniref:SAM-dependent methyltransferase n=1 Tax=Halospeciosus flavus TaxID=3032283 RepID=UPI003619BF28
MKGHVPTPDDLADHIVEKLFRENPPAAGETILYPGCGKGPFIAAVERYCNTNGHPIPEGVAIELDPEHLTAARERHADLPVEFQERDFLGDVADLGEFEYIVGNPRMFPSKGSMKTRNSGTSSSSIPLSGDSTSTSSSSNSP